MPDSFDFFRLFIHPCSILPYKVEIEKSNFRAISRQRSISFPHFRLSSFLVNNMLNMYELHFFSTLFERVGGWGVFRPILHKKQTTEFAKAYMKWKKMFSQKLKLKWWGEGRGRIKRIFEHCSINMQNSFHYFEVHMGCDFETG